MLGLSNSYSSQSQSSLLSLGDWKKSTEFQGLRSNCVDKNGNMLEYETYELIRNPPNVTIDNSRDENCSVITLDSANRPGTLVEVVTQLTEQGLNIRKARISSDGGWFVDVFHVTYGLHGGQIKEQQKIQTVLQEVLAASMESEREHNFGEDELDDSRVCSTVFELGGNDRPGLLAEITFFLKDNGCDVRSAAVWTHNNRVAFVLSVTEQGQPIQDHQKLNALQQRMLEKMMSCGGSNATLNSTRVTGLVHHERRLHQILLREEQKRWQEQQSGFPETVLESDEDAASDLIQPNSYNSQTMAGSPDCTLYPEDLYRSPKAAKPLVKICKDNQRGYWFVQVKCKDRHKLFFDTVCTLSDLDYDIFHASVDEVEGVGYQEYYVKPRWGQHRFCEEKAAELKWMLEMSVMRRHPKGLKIHVHSTDRFGCLADLTKVLADSDLCITRAKAKLLSGRSACEHTLYVMHVNGGPPCKEVVERACQNIGGKHVSFGEERQAASSLGIDHKFSFSFLERWNRELGGSPYSLGASSSDN